MPGTLLLIVLSRSSCSRLLNDRAAYWITCCPINTNVTSRPETMGKGKSITDPTRTSAGKDCLGSRLRNRRYKLPNRRKRNCCPPLWKYLSACLRRGPADTAGCSYSCSYSYIRSQVPSQRTHGHPLTAWLHYEPTQFHQHPSSTASLKQ